MAFLTTLAIGTLGALILGPKIKESITGEPSTSTGIFGGFGTGGLLTGVTDTIRKAIIAIVVILALFLVISIILKFRK